MRGMLSRPFPLLVLVGFVAAAVAAQQVQVYSGFSTDCQSCLDSATSLCDSSRAFENCVCLGDGFEEVMSTCLGELSVRRTLCHVFGLSNVFLTIRCLFIRLGFHGV